MSRPVDWHPLADSDPVPGDPIEVARLSRQLRDTATTISDQANSLRNLCTSEFWESEAGRKFRATAVDTADKLTKAFRRYDTAATQVANYGPQLDAAQQLSLKARQAALDADAAQHSATNQLNQAAAEAKKNNTPAIPNDPTTARLKNAQTAAAANLTAARATLEHAKQIRDAAARLAANAIDDAIAHDGLKDGWTDKFKNWIHEHADIIKAIGDWCGKISALLGMLSLCIGWIPVFGQVLAGFLDSLALVLGAVGLICDLALAISGDGSWSDVAMDALTVATLGVGRAAKLGAKAGAKGVEAGAKMSKAANNVGTRILHTTGTRLSKQALVDMAKGDLTLAAQESGMHVSQVRGWVGEAWGEASSTLPGLGQSATRSLTETGSIKNSLSFIKQGFSPSGLANDFVDGFRNLPKLVHPSTIVREEGVTKTFLKAELDGIRSLPGVARGARALSQGSVAVQVGLIVNDASDNVPEVYDLARGK